LIFFLALSQERQSQLNNTKQELEKFWLNVNKLLEKPDNKKPMLQNIARFKFNLNHDPQLKSWFELEARVTFLNFQFLIKKVS
jgi:hypothetical protein